MFPSVLIAVSR